MITDALSAIGTATKRLARHWPAMILLAVLYLLLLTSIYLFVTTHEATVLQVVLTFSFAAVTVALFFVFQTAAATYLDTSDTAALLTGALRKSWKLLVVSLPVIALGIGVFYLLATLAARVDLSGVTNIPAVAVAENPSARLPLKWSLVVISGVRYLILGLALPLLLLRLWLTAAQDGIKHLVSNLSRILLRALAPESVFIYAAGLVVCGVVPYLLLFKSVQTTHTWLELGLFTVRLIAAYLFTLLGWVITLGALTLAKSAATEAAASDGVKPDNEVLST
jgi:hypothetical protein